MDLEDILVAILSICLVTFVFYVAVLLPIDIYFDTGANTDCLLAGYDSGYREGIAFGQNICKEVVQEEVINYTVLK